MPRTSPFAAFVHEFTTRSGATRFAVAEWVERAAQYQWPLPAASRSGGLHTGFSRYPGGSDWRYTTRRSALAAARRLYGERVAEEAQEREWDRRERDDQARCDEDARLY